MRRVHWLTACGVILLVSRLGAFAEPSPRQIREADRYSRFGNQALKSGNLGKARILFGKATKAFPAFPDAHVGLGHVAMGEKSFHEALDEYRLAQSAYVDFSDALFDLQLLHYSEAQDQINKLRDEASSYRRLMATRSYGNSATIDRKITELEEQIQRLQMVRTPALDPKSREAPGEVHFYIGNALFNLGRLEDAVQEWEACARMSPRFPLVYNNLAVAYWKKGSPEEALTTLKTAERLGLPVNSRFRTDLEHDAIGVSNASLSKEP